MAAGRWRAAAPPRGVLAPPEGIANRAAARPRELTCADMQQSEAQSA